MSWLRTTPNLISLGRAALGPVVLALLMNSSFIALLMALVIVGIATASDYFDGYLARRRGTARELGRYLDAACDAIFSLGVFLGFLANDWLPASWFLAIYFAEIVVPYAGAFTKQLGYPSEIRWSARVKTSVHPPAQFVLILAALFLADPAGAGDTMIGIAASGAAVLASLAYLADHVVLTARRTVLG
jgi:phosphatidylglycerophosphate synthase